MRNQTKKSHCRHHDRFDVRRGLLLHHHLVLLLLLLLEGPCVKIVLSFQPIPSPTLRRTTIAVRRIEYNNNNNNPQQLYDSIARASPSRRNPLVAPTSTTTLFGSSSFVVGGGSPLRLAAIAGLLSAGLQWTISFLLKNQKRESSILLFKETAEYTSHSIVALGLMILLSGLGIYHWWWIMPATTTTSTTTASRILLHSPLGQTMASIVLGCFLAWDIPTSLRVSALRKADVIIHHCVMSLLALLGCTILPMQYILYYFGVVELSSIPLIVYDQISHWITTIQQQNFTNDANTNDENDQASLLVFSKKLETIKSKLGILTALAFTLVRVISFTKVTVLNFIPDCFQALRVLAGSTTASAAVLPKIWTIRFLMFACGGFNLLQLYWFYQIIQTATNGNADYDDRQ